MNFDEVEYYNRRHDEWISCPSMLQKKGSLSGATLSGKIFAIGGIDGVECLSNVEMFDPAIGKWIINKPMLCKVSFLFPTTVLSNPCQCSVLWVLL